MEQAGGSVSGILESCIDFGRFSSAAGTVENFFAQITLPLAVCTAAGLILLLRSLRHEPKVYLGRKFQSENMIATGLFFFAVFCTEQSICYPWRCCCLPMALSADSLTASFDSGKDHGISDWDASGGNPLVFVPLFYFQTDCRAFGTGIKIRRGAMETGIGKSGKWRKPDFFL